MDGMEGTDRDSAVSVPEQVDDPVEETAAATADAPAEPERYFLGLTDAEAPAAPAPDWWHRDHPTFSALPGFFTGLVVVAVLPAIFYGLLRGIFSERVAEEAFPFVLLFLAVPIGLMVFPRTRRFGTFLLLGMLVTLLVVFGVGTFVFWLMLSTST